MAYFSKNSADYVSAINALKKPTYESKYNNLIENQLNKILNREDFSYDFNADPLYQNYKDQYTKLGKEASMNAAASASALTGGYGNSYAGTAASQANQQYLTQLNGQIPALMNAAMDRYKMQTEQLYNQFGALQQEESRQYGQHRDDVSDYYSDWSNLESGYSTALQQEDWERDFAYRQERDKIADEQWQKNYDYNASRAGVSDSQWEKNFAYQQERDKVADTQWQKNYELALRKARSGGSGSGGSRSNGRYTTNTTWKGGTYSDPGKLGKQQFTEQMAVNVLEDNNHKTNEDKLSAIDNWLNMGYITENDAAILMDLYNL